MPDPLAKVTPGFGQLSTRPNATIKSATTPIGVMPPMKTLLSLRDLRDLPALLSPFTTAK